MIAETSRGMERRVIMKHDLSPNEPRFLELMQTVNFGRIEGVVVLNGEPALDPQPRIVHVIKFGGENGCRPEMVMKDFALRKEVVHLFERLSGLDDGSVVDIEVKHGLPFKMEVEIPTRTRTV